MSEGNGDVTELQAIIEFAVKAHAGQLRKHGGLPYICHPMAVVSQLVQWDIFDHLTWKAAFCHDILEECPHITSEELVSVIGPEAAAVVGELTFIVDPASLFTHKEQKSQYLETFFTTSVHALVIKAADRALNSMDFLCVTPQYARTYWYLGKAIFKAVAQRGEEIKQKFGASSFPRIMHTRSHLNGVFQ